MSEGVKGAFDIFMQAYIPILITCIIGGSIHGIIDSIKEKFKCN